MDRLQAMQVYIQVVENGSFTAAADVLQMHRPAVSRAVQQLEQELGLRLLHRTTRKVSMTAEGEAFYQRCIHALAEVNEVFSVFSQPSLVPTGRLRIDLPVTLARGFIIPALRDFQQRYPQVELVLGATDQPIDLIATGVDCAVRLGKLQDSSMIARRIGSIPMVTCASPDYLARHGIPRTLQDLEKHLAVNYFSGPNRRVMDWIFSVDGQTVTHRLRSGILTNDSETFLSCALAGFGLIQGLEPEMRPALDSGQLIEILADIPTAPKPVSILFPNRSYLAPRVRVFVDWLTELVGRNYPI